MLNVGDLVATMAADTQQFERAIDGAEERFARVAREIAQSAQRAEEAAVIEPEVDTSEAEAELQGMVRDADRAAERASDAAVIEPTVDESEVEGMGDRLAGLAAAAGAVAGVAFAGALVGAFEEERVGDKIGASLGGDRAFDSAAYGRLAGKLYAEAYGESVEEVGGAITAVATTLPQLDPQGLEAATRMALDFAATMDIDVTKAVNTVGVVLKTGLAKDANEAFDLVTAASQRVPAHLREDVMDAAEEYLPFFKSLGFTGEEAFSLLVKASEKGTYGIDKMGDSIKETTLLLTDIGSTGVTDAYKAIGLDAKTMSNAILAGGETAQTAFMKIVKGLQGIKDPSDQAAAAVALFGTPLEDMNKTEIPEFLKSLEDGRQEMAGFGGEATNMGKTLNDNAATQIESFKRTVMAGLSDAGTAILLPLIKIATQVAGVLGPALREGAELWQQYAGWLNPVAVFLGVLLAGVLAFMAAQRIWMALQAAHTAVIAAWNAVLAANPIGLIVLALLALVAALVYAYRNSETFREVVDTVFSAIATAAKWLWETILKPTFTAIGAVLSWLGQFFLATGMLIWYVVKTVFGPAFEGMGIALKWVYETIIKPTVNAIVAVFNWAVDKISSAWSAISGPIGAAFGVVLGIVKGAINSLIGLVNTATRFINNTVLSNLNKVPGVNFPMIPAIPRLATGGTVQPSAGGTPVIMGDGGEVEYGIPRSDMRSIIGEAVRAGGGRSELIVHFRGDGIMRGIRETTRVQGGSNRGAQTVLVGA